MRHEGGCLCGSVRFIAQGEPVNVRFCHCRLCQKATGGPFFVRALFDQRHLTVNGRTDGFASSERISRVFCPRCGTHLFTWRTNGTFAGVALTTFDDRNAFRPTHHAWVAEKVQWLRLDDGLLQYPNSAPD